MISSARYHPVVDRVCSTEPGSETSRKEARDEIVDAINGRSLSILDLVILLAGPLTSPEKEARENGTRLLGEVVGRCRPVLGEVELHKLAEFLAARLKDWPCVGAAAAACRSLLLPPPPLPPTSATDPAVALGALPGGGGGEGGRGGGARLGDEGALIVVEATAEMLRSAQSFRHEERGALLQLLLAVVRGGWGGLAVGRRGVPLLDCFLGAADGEKDPRCLLLAFEALRALCEMYHAPGVDVTPLQQLADEVADWASSYFPISFNPPPSLAGTRGVPAITRQQLAASLELALASSPFLAGGVLPLMVEKLSSTYRPAKEDALSALRCCCPAYGAEALGPHLGKLWQALRAEIMAPCGHGGVGGGGAGPAGGSETDAQLALAASAASCLTVVVRAAGAGKMDALALQDACVGDLLTVILHASSSPPWPGGASVTRGSANGQQVAVSRGDCKVLCGSLVLSAIAAAGPASLCRTHAGALVKVQSMLAESLAPAADVPDGLADQTLYGLTVLATVVDAVAGEILPPGGGDAIAAAAATARAWTVPDAADGVAVLAEVKGALLAALAVVHARLHLEARSATTGGNGGGGGATAESMAVDAAAPPSAADAAPKPDEAARYSPAAAVQLRLAAVGAWHSLLRLHEAAAAQASTTVQHLTLAADELASAAEQVCCAALAEGTAPAGLQMSPARMRWGRHTDAAQEATAALQLLLQQLQPRSPAAAAATANTARPGAAADHQHHHQQQRQQQQADSSAAVVHLLVARLTAAMMEGSGNGGWAGGGEDWTDGCRSGEGVGGIRGAALRLAARLAQTAAPGAGGERSIRTADGGDVGTAGGAGGGGGGGAEAFAAALLWALPPVVLKRGVGSNPASDEKWLKDCLTRLATEVLPPLSPGAAPIANTTAAAVAAATHRLVATTLREAAEWEAAGGSGLPFRSAVPDEDKEVAEETAAAAPPQLPSVTPGSLTAAAAAAAAAAAPTAFPSLMTAWCAAVQQLTACCNDRQQLDLAMEAAEIITAAAAAVPLPGGAGGVACRPLAASVPLACSVVGGLRPGVLAAQSTQALADSLLRLLAEAEAARPAAATITASSGSIPLTAASASFEHALATAAVALAAVVNRWQDAPSLDSWLCSAFRPALLQRLGTAAADAVAASGTASLPSAAVVRAVSWMGRALALRNHSAGVTEALISVLRWEEPGGYQTPMRTATASATAAAAARPTSGATSAPPSMEADDDPDVRMDEGPGTDGGAPGECPGKASGAVVESYGSCTAAAAVEAAVTAAAEAFGVLVADVAEVGGVALAARSPQSVCRVLWQQRTYSLCLQALESECRYRQQERCQGTPGGAALRLPLRTAMAVAALAGSAPRQMCRNDAARLAPLLLRSLQSICGCLGCGKQGPPAAAAATAVAAVARLSPPPSSLSSLLPASVAVPAVRALREALAVLRDWLEAPKAASGASCTTVEQLERVLQDHVGQLADCVCAAMQVGAAAAPGRRGPRSVPAAAAAAAAVPGAAADPVLLEVDPALTAAVREEALRCCSGLMDALPYHVLHPMRQQVVSCVVRALDDNRRSVRQLAVRARCAWGDA